MKLGRKIAEGFAVDEEPLAEPAPREAAARVRTDEVVSAEVTRTDQEPVGTPTRV
jgi:hypothetical protein